MPENELPQEPAARAVRERILDWAGPGFPLEVRDSAARVYNDFIRERAGEEVDAFVHELRFGTGGLRGVIGFGPGRMNLWTVGRTTQGLCNYLKKKFKRPTIVIAHDSRRMSPEFAATAAGIAAGMGLKAHLFSGVAPTPVLSYAIRKLRASGGIVITASHNPPEYNGYKVYMDDGSQLVGNAQIQVEAEIEKVREWWSIPFVDEKSETYRKNVKRIGSDLKTSYYGEFKDTPFVSPARKQKKDLKIVYSPLHGTGGPWLPGLLRKYGFQVDVVSEQEQPDGEFPTVKFPNPEEREALKLAEERARSTDADLFLATDPDADRLGGGFKTGPGQYELLNGNQIGSIMCAYLVEKIAAGSQKGGTRWHVFKTIVTTDLQREIAHKNGIAIHEVLTGFKYIAEQMRLLEQGDRSAGFQKGKDRYLFGGEESYGYLPVDFVRDKDSLASALLLCEIVAEVGDIVAYLNQIYLKYGLFLEDLKSVTLKGSQGQARMQEILNRLREENLVGWSLGSRRVSGVLDFQAQTRDGQRSPAHFRGLPESNVLQLLLEPEGKLTIRPSGTEPKVKLYASLRHPVQPTSLEELTQARSELENELASVSGHFIARTGLAG